jgi:hypothetical protein
MTALLLRKLRRLPRLLRRSAARTPAVLAPSWIRVPQLALHPEVFDSIDEMLATAIDAKPKRKRKRA